MICKDCREGGNYLVAVDLSYDNIEDHDLREASEMHSKCKGGSWCDCQHGLTARGKFYGRVLIGKL